MAEVVIVYITLQGHTERVAERVAHDLLAAGHRATLANAGEAPELGGFDAAILGAPVQMGHVAAPVVAYARAHAAELQRMPSGFFSVSLTAAHDDDASRQAIDRYLRDFQNGTGWRPDVIASFAGALRFTQYSLLHRALMRQVAAKEGLAGDGREDRVYTDWDAVGGFVEAFLHHLRRATEPGLSSVRPAST
jgi:menaquinone-dependent protoporphyrinogen oxidase